MSDITAAEEKLNDVNREINKILQDKETHDITSLTKLGEQSFIIIPLFIFSCCNVPSQLCGVVFCHFNR